MLCILCRIFDPHFDAAADRWAKSPWDQPNDDDAIFCREENQDALRAAYDLWTTDPSRALKEFTRYAELGSVWSSIQVGRAFLLGWGTEVSPPEAEIWLRRAIEAGSEGAMLSLANHYRRAKRLDEAESLLGSYVEKSYAPAVYLLGWVYIDKRKNDLARVMFERASASGHRLAKWYLARFCLNGRFGIRSIPRGFRLVGELRQDIEQAESDPVVGALGHRLINRIQILADASFTSAR
jgi:TPR repeat protein